jgi:hypothetical protein
MSRPGSTSGGPGFSLGTWWLAGAGDSGGMGANMSICGNGVAVGVGSGVGVPVSDGEGKPAVAVASEIEDRPVGSAPGVASAAGEAAAEPVRAGMASDAAAMATMAIAAPIAHSRRRDRSDVHTARL